MGRQRPTDFSRAHRNIFGFMLLLGLSIPRCTTSIASHHAFVALSQRKSTFRLLATSESSQRLQQRQQQKAKKRQQQHVRQNSSNIMTSKEVSGNQKHQQQQQQQQQIRAKIVSLGTLNECGARLRQGELVAFPTETVYGLGCNALDPSAISKVFEAKERPLTDPLITHVSDPEVAFGLWSADDSSVEGKALRALCKTFWPGPLTLVSKAAPHVPPTLMANTGFVACRSPQHPISISLIDAAQVPLAAPSANKFGHVSPTRASHVYDDLLYEDVWIIDADAKTDDICNVGVESSVAKIEMIQNPDGSDDCKKEGKITLLRQGAVSAADMSECLAKAGLGDVFTVMSNTRKATNEKTATVAPGQTIKHYSPLIPSFILSESLCQATAGNAADAMEPAERQFLSHSVVIDFGGKLSSWKDSCLDYRDLSGTADSSAATRLVYDTLRWAESIKGAKQILFPPIPDTSNGGANNGDSAAGIPDALTLALKDRLTRAASGVTINKLEKQ